MIVFIGDKHIPNENKVGDFKAPKGTPWRENLNVITSNGIPTAYQKNICTPATFLFLYKNKSWYYYLNLDTMKVYHTQGEIEIGDVVC